MPTVTKAELASILTRDLHCTEVLAHKLVDALFGAMREAILRGDRIEIRGFGSWTVKTTNARPQARNPRTGEVIVVPARRKVRFKPGRIIKEALTRLMQPLAQELWNSRRVDLTQMPPEDTEVQEVREEKDAVPF